MENSVNQNKDIIIGKNCVTEAIKSGREIDAVHVARGSKTGRIPAILALAREKGIPIKEVDVKKLDYLCGNGVHQGIVAFAAVKQYSNIEDIFALAEKRGEDPFIIVLDEIEDPHNLGAIIRTAECAGAHGVIIPKRRASGLTFTVDKASAGALEYVPVVRVANIAQTIELLKEKNVWVYGADMGGEELYKSNLTGSVAVVIGSEGKGISRLVKEKCDHIIALPMKGKISSLNASVAAGVIMYEIARQRER